MEESFEFEQDFGARMGGKTVSIYDAEGNLLGQWTVPTGGGIISSSVSAASLDGAYWDVDGVVGSIDDPNFNPSFAVEAPGFSLGFDGTYLGGEFQIRRDSDGSVAFTGQIPGDLDDLAVGTVTVATGDTATVWTRVPAGDGMGGTWIPTQVKLGGNDNTFYSFTGNPQATPVPTPATPTASPAPSPLPAPSPVVVTNSSTVTPGPVSTNDVSVDVDELPVPESDDGEETVLEQVVSMHEKIRGILNDFQAMFENVALTYQEFNQVAFGGVGQACTLQFGEVTINLGNIVPGFVRNGLKLVILLTVLFSAIRMTWDTFTSY